MVVVTEQPELAQELYPERTRCLLSPPKGCSWASGREWKQAWKLSASFPWQVSASLGAFGSLLPLQTRCLCPTVLKTDYGCPKFMRQHPKQPQRLSKLRPVHVPGVENLIGSTWTPALCPGLPQSAVGVGTVKQCNHGFHWGPLSITGSNIFYKNCVAHQLGRHPQSCQLTNSGCRDGHLTFLSFKRDIQII